VFEIGRFGPDQKQINLLSWRNMPGARKQRPASAAGDWIEARCARRGHLLLDWEGKGRLLRAMHSCN
jgi:hypothetical protein